MNYSEWKEKSPTFRLLFLPLLKYDFIQIISASLLILTGILFIYGLGQQTGTPEVENVWMKQLFWAAIGVLAWVTLAVFTDYRKFKVLTIPIYLVAVFLLVAVLIKGAKINEARRWLSIGGFRLQPSEFAKIALVIFNASLASFKNFNINRFQDLCAVAFFNAIPILLIAAEPDLGTAVIMIPVIGGIYFIAGLKWRWIVLAAVLAGAAVPVAYPFLKDYQKERIKVFLDPQRDPANRGWNALQSQIAVGSGGLFGKGFMQGTQNTLGFLPRTVSKTDFIFSAIAEETGFVGSIILIFLYFTLICSMIWTALTSSDNFGRYLAIGFAGIFFIHSFVNISMTMRLLPVKGLPLPLVSYGGSFMITSFICLGILQSVFRRRYDELK